MTREFIVCDGLPDVRERIVIDSLTPIKIQTESVDTSKSFLIYVEKDL